MESLFEILESIQSLSSENESSLNISTKLIEWNQLVEQEWTTTDPNFKLLSSNNNLIKNLSIDLQKELLNRIQKHSPDIYSRKKQKHLFINELVNDRKERDNPTTWIESDLLVNDLNALASNIATCILYGTNSYSQPISISNDQVNRHLVYITHLIQTCKNVIRYNRILWSHYKRNQRTHGMHGSEADFYQNNSTSNLCTLGMIQLYLALLQMNSQYETSPSTVSTTTTSSSTVIAADHNDVVVDDNADQDNIIRDDLARQAATILFHATFAHSEEPYCKKALRDLVSREMNGPMILAELITRPNPVAVVLPLMKNIHNMMSVYPIIISEMDSALSRLQKKHEPVISSSSRPWSLLTILITTLAWCIHSTPTFPGPMADRRTDLSMEILKMLLAMRNVLGRNQLKEMEGNNTEVMVYLLKLLVQIFHLDHRDRRIYECKLSALMLLMDSPEEWNPILLRYHVVEQLILIFWYQLNEYTVERADIIPSENTSTSLLPILLVLNKLCKNESKIREQVKHFIFPVKDEDAFLEKFKHASSEKNMHPIDAPKGTTRFKLISLMTCTETNLKRCSSELLWTLCNHDSKEFILRCGFGNAVHQLGVKGIYSLPK